MSIDHVRMNELVFNNNILKFEQSSSLCKLCQVLFIIQLIHKTINFFINKSKMSQLRKRHSNFNQSLHIKRRKVLQITPKLRQSKLHTQPGESKIHSQSINMQDRAQNLFNKNVHLFRQIYNSNDQSQLPFMSTLRMHPKDNNPPKPTSQEPFEVSMKSTCNQTTRKSVSDFKTASKRLATSYYRWHNKTGRHSLWSAQFQCSLRDYGERAQEKRYYSYVKPIEYKDFQEKTYKKQQMVCDRYKKSFAIE